MKEEYKKCGGPAHVRYTWPGKDQANACLIHAIEIEGIAKAMGLHLQFIPIDWMDEKTMKEMPICQTNERVKTSDNK